MLTNKRRIPPPVRPVCQITQLFDINQILHKHFLRPIFQPVQLLTVPSRWRLNSFVVVLFLLWSSLIVEGVTHAAAVEGMEVVEGMAGVDGVSGVNKFCSPVTPVYSTTRLYPTNNKPVVETYISLNMQMGSSVCLMTRPPSVQHNSSSTNSSTPSPPSHLLAVLHLESISLLHQVRSSYQFLVPSLSVSCYCQCQPSSCQMSCSSSSCYNISQPGPPCSSSSSTPSSTCCSLQLSTPSPPLTAIQLGSPSILFHYNLDLFSPRGRLTSSRKFTTLSSTTTHHMTLEEDLELFINSSPPHISPRHSPGSWLVKDMDGNIAKVPVNHLAGTDTTKAGWLKVVKGSAAPPPPLVVRRGTHVTTEDCEGQEFTADVSGINMEKVDFTNSHLGLSLKGTRSVEEILPVGLSASFTLATRGPFECLVFQNSSTFGSFTGWIHVGMDHTKLHLSFNNSCGLFMGNVGHYRFSTTVSPCTGSVARVVPLPPTFSNQSSPLVCLYTENQEKCARARVLEAPLLKVKAIARVHHNVHNIPFVRERRPSEPEKLLTLGPGGWLANLLGLSKTTTIVINCVGGFLIILFVCKLVMCVSPNCKKS